MDIHARNNVDWTESHVTMFIKNGVTDVAKVLYKCKHLKFPTNKQMEQAEKDLAIIMKQKDKKLHNPRKKSYTHDTRFKHNCS